jgi:hypothetical protein
MQITNKIYVIIALHYWRKYTISVETDQTDHHSQW